MFKRQLPYLYFAFTFLGMQQVHAAHTISTSAGTANLSWEELDENNERLNKENANLSQLEMQYSYAEKNQKLTLAYSSLFGVANYVGKNANNTGTPSTTTTDYDIQVITVEYGAWFDVDYIKPYAALLGGYHHRKRFINSGQSFEHSVDETFDNWFWGTLLEAELFSWNDLSLEIGGKFTHSFKGENTITNYYYLANYEPADKLVIRLEATNNLEFFSRLNYTFYPSWEVSLIASQSTAKTKVSHGAISVPSKGDVPAFTKNAPQPKSKQKISYIGISLSKSF